jgi:hypothetical protein
LNTGSSRRSERSESSRSRRSGRSNSFRSTGGFIAQPLLAGGGRTQGAVIVSPHGRSNSGTDLVSTAYRPSVHGWHLPEGTTQSNFLATDMRLHDGAAIPGTWTWNIHKARNHIGAGNKGVIGKGDVCGTMVSGDTPGWFVGLRTVQGPFNCKAVPVWRCPRNYIEGQNLCVRAQRYEQGDHLDITAHLEETSRMPTPVISRGGGNEPHWRKDFKGYQRNGRAAEKPSDLVGGGCQIRAGPQISCKVITRERFDPGNAVRAGTKFCDR